MFGHYNLYVIPYFLWHIMLKENLSHFNIYAYRYKSINIADELSRTIVF
jgi:hypothetical protein